MKKEVFKIYLFRHGQTTFNRDKIFTGHLDSKLTKEGVLHAEKIAKALKDKNFQVAIHTRLSRSKDTLNAVLIFHPECKIVLQDDRMIERSYGVYSGMSHENFIKKYGTERYDQIHRGYRIASPKGESLADVERRVKKFIGDLKKFMRKEKVNVAISAHGNSIRVFRKIMEKTSEKEASKWVIPYDKVFTYKV